MKPTEMKSAGTTTITPKDLLNNLLDINLQPQDEKEVASLGRENLQVLISYWRYEATETTKYITGYQEMVDSLKDFEAVAAKHESPVFPDIVCRDFGTHGKIKMLEVPEDRESVQREDGATTFNCCGWCKWCGQFEYSGNCKVEGCCELLERSKTDHQKNVFNTPCMVRERLPEALELATQKLEDACLKKSRIDAIIRILFRLKQQAQSRPVFADQRPKDHFKKGMKVVVYREKDEAPLEGWYFGEMIDDDTAYFCRQVNYNKWGPQKALEIPKSHLGAVTLDEFNYLSENRDFALIWVRNHQTHSGGITPEKFQQILDAEQFPCVTVSQQPQLEG